MNIRVKYGKAKIEGKHIVKIKYSGFAEVPSVTATIADTFKLGANVSLRDVTATGATCYCYYNGGEELYDGTIHWIAVGATYEQKICNVHGHKHPCLPNVYH